MCRLALKTASEPFSPYEVLTAMEAMQEGYDGSGLGLLLRGMEFEDFRYNPKFPILSGIAHSDKAWRRLDDFMEERGYELKYDHQFDMRPGSDRGEGPLSAISCAPTGCPTASPGSQRGSPRRRAAADPPGPQETHGEQHGNDLTVFSFWPDVTIIKEVGWPMQIGDALGLHDGQIKSRVCMAQGRQNTNYGINLYACHPFFLQGISTMTNGENTAFVPIKDWLLGRGFPGYIGYQSDSEVFTHILHYVLKKLKLPLQAYKHVITPLNNAELADHPQGLPLAGLRNVCRRLIIDGPNAVIGTLPDETCLLVMDQKKLRPATVGGREGVWAIASEMCGVDAMIPDRDAPSISNPCANTQLLFHPT